MKEESAKCLQREGNQGHLPSLGWDDALGAVNVELLRQLLDDPRLSISELARRVAMSAPAVRERRQRLQETGVIEGFLNLRPEALGFPVTAFVRVKPVPGGLAQIAKIAEELESATECYRITGDDCFLAKVYAPSIEELEAALDRFLAYGTTSSSIVVSTPVPQRSLPLPANR